RREHPVPERGASIGRHRRGAERPERASRLTDPLSAPIQRAGWAGTRGPEPLRPVEPWLRRNAPRRGAPARPRATAAPKPAAWCLQSRCTSRAHALRAKTRAIAPRPGTGSTENDLELLELVRIG